MPPCSHFPTFLVNREWEVARASPAENCPPHRHLFSTVFSASIFLSPHHGGSCPSGAFQQLNSKRPSVGFALTLAKSCFCMISSATQFSYPLKSHSQPCPANMPPVTYILLLKKAVSPSGHPDSQVSLCFSFPRTSSSLSPCSVWVQF